MKFFTVPAKFLFALMLMIPALLFAATPQDPVRELESVSQQVLVALKANQEKLKTDKRVVLSIIDRYLLPHFSVPNMVKDVVGRNTWRSASAQEQSEFTKQFTQLVLKTYASALSSYNNQSITFAPLHRPLNVRTGGEIKSTITQPGRAAIQVSYRMQFVNGEWKICDFSVDNISMISSFRAQFAEEIKQNGLAALNNRLKGHNQGN